MAGYLGKNRAQCVIIMQIIDLDERSRSNTYIAQTIVCTSSNNHYYPPDKSSMASTQAQTRGEIWFNKTDEFET